MRDDKKNAHISCYYCGTIDERRTNKKRYTCTKCDEVQGKHKTGFLIISGEHNQLLVIRGIEYLGIRAGNKVLVIWSKSKMRPAIQIKSWTLNLGRLRLLDLSGKKWDIDLLENAVTLTHTDGTLLFNIAEEYNGIKDTQRLKGWLPFKPHVTNRARKELVHNLFKDPNIPVNDLDKYALKRVLYLFDRYKKPLLKISIPNEEIEIIGNVPYLAKIKFKVREEQ